jgi:uncharacterized Ntn-hydrolase superfamily protein
MHFMSPTKPRITITLEPVTALQLKRISELTGNSQSSMVSEVLEQAVPVFERLIKVLEAAQAAQQSAQVAQRSVKVQSVKNLDAAQRRIEKQMGLVLDDFDETTAPLLKELEQVTRRARRKVGDAALHTHSGEPVGRKLTPPSNRGVRSNLTDRKTTSQKRVKA